MIPVPTPCLIGKRIFYSSIVQWIGIDFAIKGLAFTLFHLRFMYATLIRLMLLFHSDHKTIRRSFIIACSIHVGTCFHPIWHIGRPQSMPNIYSMYTHTPIHTYIIIYGIPRLYNKIPEMKLYKCCFRPPFLVAGRFFLISSYLSQRKCPWFLSMVK